MDLTGVAETVDRLDSARYTVLLPGDFLELASTHHRQRTDTA
jgi:hypothetical protein